MRSNDVVQNPFGIQSENSSSEILKLKIKEVQFSVVPVIDINVPECRRQNQSLPQPFPLEHK